MPVRDSDDPYSFSARSYDWRLHCADEAIENFLKEEVIRAGAKRAFVVCSKSITGKTRSVERIKGTLGNLFAGYYDGIEIDSTYKSVKAATDAARAAGADLLISVGGGSVVVATRVVDVFLCEEGDPFEIMTQYPEGKPAYSPRLNAPKLPIINIVTTPTSAMNRGGSGLANPDLDQRMEYFDPKTRPAALIFDYEAIMSSPLELMRSTGTGVFSGAIMGAGSTGYNPLAEGDHEHILRLAKRSYLRMFDEPTAVEPRIDLFIAALLQNRSADDSLRGAHVRGNEAFGGDYALATAMHVRYPHVWQGEAGSSLRPTITRRAPTPPIEAAKRVAVALDIWQDGMGPEDAKMKIADEIERIYKHVGMPTRVRELNIPKEDIPVLAKETVKVFNANAGLRNADQQMKGAVDLLEAAW